MSDEMDAVQERVLQAQDAMQAARLARVPVPSLKPPALFCADCGEDLDPRRVRALPHCTRCVMCQGRAERRGGVRA